MLPDQWKEEHDYRLQELVRLPGQRCKRTRRSKDGVDSGVYARKVFGQSGKRLETFRTPQ